MSSTRQPLRAHFAFPDDVPLRFRAPREERSASSVEEIPALLAQADRQARAGRWVACLVAYEAAPAFDRALRVQDEPAVDRSARSVESPNAALPLAWMAVFDAPEPEPAAAGADGADGAFTLTEWTDGAGRQRFEAAVRRIRAAIADGEVYQVNHTIRLRAGFEGDPLAFHHALCAAQGAGYCAYLALGDLHVLSASPELFFRRTGRAITTRPMKGTAPRGRWVEEDEANVRRLQESAKDRAENVMIVDLLRNDLGRVAEPGSVEVPRLFEVERYRTVLQATSTITATLRANVALPELFAALFPCGSVTGAPKVAAMRMIAELEDAPRQAYCGAIGLLRPGGDATFNVAIRTVTIDQRAGTAEYGAGGGITWDSSAGGEYAEVAAKSAILTARWPSFDLLETMRLDEGQYGRLDAHLERMAESARYFGFTNPRDAARKALGRHASAHSVARRRVRLLASADGSARVESTPLEPPRAGTLGIALHERPVSSRDPFLFHKTTHRAVYDAARAAHPGAFDVLLVNERGEVTEFCTGNVVAEIDDVRWTPPRGVGLLAGIFRGELLRRGEVRERTLLPDDIRRASRLWLVNSVREWVAVALETG